jgi:PAS domain S-box-containing protein
MSSHVSDRERVITDNVLSGGGEMGALMRSLDWSKTSIGAVTEWPQSLRTAVSICLSSRFPILIWWGPDYVKLYNDAYRPMLGRKHPKALGQCGAECWPEIWPIIGPMLEGVITRGEATWSEDQLLLLDRNGYVEECYFTFSYSPIRDETGRVGGIFTAVTETTQRVLGERRLRTLRALAAEPAEARTPDDACSVVTRILGLNPHDLPFTLLYLLDDQTGRARLMGSTGIDPGRSVTHAVVDLRQGNSTAAPWPFERVMDEQSPVLMTGLPSTVGVLPGGPWDDAPTSGIVLPIAKPGQRRPIGFQITGISPRRAFDDEYRGFVELVAGHIAAAIANARAHEEERSRAEALAEIDRAKNVFFSNVSHEFRTPLTLMLSPIEDLLERRDLPIEKAQELLGLVHRNGLRMLKLVNTLLEFSRIEAGRIEAVYESTDLARYTAELASVFRSAIEKAGLRLIVDCPPVPDAVYVDRDMWEKIVLNLMSNAFKFTFEGWIVVSLTADERQVSLCVQDTGTGIAPEHLPRVFERFHRIRGARSRTHEGTGIGLALVHELVKLHGGAVTVESAYGRGTTFTVSIPLGKAHLPQDRLGVPRTSGSTAMGAAPYVEEALRWLVTEPTTAASWFEPGITDDQASPGAPPSVLGPPTERPRVLLADDNADMREYIRRLLSHRYEVDAAADGQTALARARERTPDLVLTDVMMPNLDGFGLLHALRSDSRTRSIPVILLSARAGEESRVEGWQAGADDYLTKPFSGRELVARVTTHLKMARMRAEWAKREEAVIRQSEEAEARLRDILDTMNEGFMVLDRQWRYSYLNRQGAKMMRRHPDDLAGKNIWELCPDAAGSLAYQEWERAMRDQIPVHGEMYYAPLQSWFEHHAYPSREGLSIFFRDVTKRKQAERQIQDLNDELRRKVQELEESKQTLQDKNDDLEKFHDLVVGRELKMIELESEVRKLKGPS